MTFFAIGGFVGVGTTGNAEVDTVRVGPEGGVDNGDVFFADSFGIVAVVFVETLFQSVIHGVDGDFAGFVAIESIEIVFLDEKEN